MLQLACTYPHGCTGTRRRRLTGIKQEEKWISPLFPAKIKLVINVCSIVNERVGKCATSTDRAFLIAQRKDNESQTALPPSLPPSPPPAAESQREHAGRGNQNLLMLQVLQDNNQTWQPPGNWQVKKKTKKKHVSKPESTLPVFSERHEVAPPTASRLVSFRAFFALVLHLKYAHTLVSSCK